MSFTLPQENARRAYQAGNLHQLYNPQPPAPSAQQQQTHLTSAPPFYRIDDNRPQVSSNGLNPNSVGAPSPGPPLQQDNYMYHLQHAAASATAVSRQVNPQQSLLNPNQHQQQVQQQSQQQHMNGPQRQQQSQQRHPMSGSLQHQQHPQVQPQLQQQQPQVMPQPAHQVQQPHQHQQQHQQHSQPQPLPQPQPQSQAQQQHQHQQTSLQLPQLSQDTSQQQLTPREIVHQPTTAQQVMAQINVVQKPNQNGSSSGSASASPNVAAFANPFPLTPDATLGMDPPPEASYPSFEALLQAVNQWGLARGYACVIGRSKKKNKVGLKKVLLTCDKGGTSKHTMLPVDSPVRRRATTSRKTGCQFSLYAVESTMEWSLKYRPDQNYCLHNHPPSKGAVDHPAARRLDKNAVAAVKALRDAGVSAQETLKQIQAAHPNAGYLPRDIYNARAAIARETEKNRDENGEMGEPDTTLIYKRRSTVNPEDKFRDECRAEVNRIREEFEAYKKEKEEKIDHLEAEIAQKDKQIHKFEMFIDICNGRVMAQRERLPDEDQVPSPAIP